MGRIKVQSAVMMKSEYIKERVSNGKFIPSQEMLDKLYDQTPEFREPIITFINDLVGDNWAVWFTPFTDEKFDVRIYCDSPDDYDKIVGVIREKLSHKEFQSFFRAGMVSDIDNQW